MNSARTSFGTEREKPSGLCTLHECACLLIYAPIHSVPGPALTGCQDQSEMGREDGGHVGQRLTQGDAAKTFLWFEVGRLKKVSERRWFCCEHPRTIGFGILGESGAEGEMKHRRPLRQMLLSSLLCDPSTAGLGPAA